jgi:hypothetical protein
MFYIRATTQSGDDWKQFPLEIEAIDCLREKITVD